MVSSRAETCLDLPSLSRSGVSVVSALVNRGFPCLCLSLCFFISLSGVVCRLCRLLCSVVPHATEQRCVVSHATEQRLLQSKRVALFLWRGVLVVGCLRWYHLSCVYVYAHIVLSAPSEIMTLMLMMMNVLP